MESLLLEVIYLGEDGQYKTIRGIIKETDRFRKSFYIETIDHDTKWIDANKILEAHIA